MVKKSDTPADIIAALNAKFGKSSARKMNQAQSMVTQVIPTGLDIFDNYLMGIGGIPVGRIGEVFGAESSGKSSFAFMCLAACQRAGGTAMICETEDSLDYERGSVFGFDPDKIVLFEPDSTEDALNQMRLALRSLPDDNGKPNILIWDSIAATPIGRQIDKDIGDSMMGRKALLLSEAMPQLSTLAKQKNCAIIFINQTRMKIGVVFGDPTTTPGGSAVKFASSWRMQLFAGKPFISSKTGEVEGIRVTMKTIKNKLSLKRGKVVNKLDFYTGWDNDWSIIELAKDKDILEPRKKNTKGNIEIALKGLAKIPGWFSAKTD